MWRPVKIKVELLVSFLFGKPKAKFGVGWTNKVHKFTILEPNEFFKMVIDLY